MALLDGCFKRNAVKKSELVEDIQSTFNNRSEKTISLSTSFSNSNCQNCSP